MLSDNELEELKLLGYLSELAVEEIKALRIKACDVLAMEVERVHIARILECPDAEHIKTPSNLPNVIRDLKGENRRLRAELVKQVRKTHILHDETLYPAFDQARGKDL